MTMQKKAKGGTSSRPQASRNRTVKSGKPKQKTPLRTKKHQLANDPPKAKSEEIIQRKSSRHRRSVHAAFWNSVAVKTQPHALRAPPKTTFAQAGSEPPYDLTKGSFEKIAPKKLLRLDFFADDVASVLFLGVFSLSCSSTASLRSTDLGSLAASAET